MLATIPAAVATPVAVAEPAAVAEAASATLVAFAVPIDFPHHRGRSVLVLLDADSQIAEHLFVEALLPLDLFECRRRRIDFHECVMRLAVLAHAVGERFHSPLFELDQIAAETLEHAFELRGEFLDLLGARVLAREEDVFVKRHADALSCLAMALSRRQALRALSGKARKQDSKAGTPDAGPIGPAAGSQWRAHGRPFSS